ncbi:efflux transporter outer membrane subunit [Novosphingobium umbonatum]|uniref:Efflux transporter outer membrane subunit n=1 Tax=Novosphingobium umbonatum TaxID=1908524 RepID=A0A437N6A0_9SPHN|nr:efflux transporter outer membrane subunit [Novosphingobium umbonatum]RVU05391.1 efflux transporter outer membrane subunit [Novosphingobium umbonatum]
MTASLRKFSGAALMLPALLAGCVAVPKGEQQFKPASAAQMGLSGIAVPVAPDWWQALGDAQLNRIMDDALTGNPSLEEATIRLRLAEAAIANAKAGLMPQASANVSAMDQRLSNAYIYPAPLGGSWRWISNAQADLSWSLDLAGRQKAMVKATGQFVQASRLQTAAARVSISGAVVQAYINLARAEAQARLAAEFVASREASLKLLTARRASGLGTELDLASARTLLAEAKQAQVRADGARAIMLHALAALAGRGTDYYASITPTHLGFDTALPVPEALPADLLGRRADLLAARAQVEMALSAKDISKADFYPDISLRAFVGSQALGIGKAFSGEALTGGFGPALHLPIFSGGAIKARYAASVAGADNAIAQYNGAVVKAVQEAADALSSLETNRTDAARQGEVVAGLQQTVALDRVRLESGLSTRLDVLNAGERLLAARQSQLDLAADGALRRVQLLVALGGGFTPIADTPAPAAKD